MQRYDPSEFTQRRTYHSFEDRAVPEVPPPATHKLRDQDFYFLEGGQRKINDELLKSHLYREGRLTESQALYILETATGIFFREPNVINVKSPLTICGDIHGYYYNLTHILDKGGNLQDTRYVFLGNYFGSGYFGIECLLYLYALKLSNRNQIILLRGQNECRSMTEQLTFKRECLAKYSEAVYEACLDSFRSLPLVALVDQRIFCVNRGIPFTTTTLPHISQVDRYREPNRPGLLDDILFYTGKSTVNSDLGVRTGAVISHRDKFLYTYQHIYDFLERNDFYSLVAGHSACEEGYTLYKRHGQKIAGNVIAIFSAPNDNYPIGAFVKYETAKFTMRKFNAEKHPFFLPDFGNAFTWSLPFIEKTFKEMVVAILDASDDFDLYDSDSDDYYDDALASRWPVIKVKILAVARILRILQLLREEAAYIQPLRLASTRRVTQSNIPTIGRLTGASRRIRDEVAKFVEISTPLVRSGLTAPQPRGLAPHSTFPHSARGEPTNNIVEDDVASTITRYSEASSRTVSTEYGVFYTRRATSQDMSPEWAPRW